LRDPDGGLAVWTTAEDHGTRAAVRLVPNEQVVGNADYDGDGYADLLTHEPGAQRLTLRLLADGQPREAAAFTLAEGWEVAASADVDGDGLADIAVRHPAGDVTELWSMQGTTLGEVLELPASPPGTSLAGAGDFDGDGRAELLWQGASRLSTWSIDAAGNIREQDLTDHDASWRVAGICDFDADGRSDLLMRSERTGKLETVTFPAARPLIAEIPTRGSFAPSDFRVASAADFDGDGDCDLVLRRTSQRYRDVALHLLEDMRPSRSQGLDVPITWELVGVGEEGPAAQP
jgi:hypothetical protein